MPEGASGGLPEEGQASVFSVPLILFFVAVLLFVALLNNRRDLILLSIMVLTLFGGADLFSRASFRRLEYWAQVDRQRMLSGSIFPGRISSVFPAGAVR